MQETAKRNRDGLEKRAAPSAVPRLLVSVGECQHLRLSQGRPADLDTDRQPVKGDDCRGHVAIASGHLDPDVEHPERRPAE